MQSTMMDVPLSLNSILERAERVFSSNEIVSRRPDKTLVRHTYGEWYRRTRALAAALQGLGVGRGDRVATLCWNHHAHLECYFGIPAVYSLENVRYPQPDGSVCGTRPADVEGGFRLDCGTGLGAATHLTATFAFAAVARALEKLLAAKDP